MVAPDNTVFFGVFGNPYNGSRGFLLHFSADLKTEYTPGAFGWDDTQSIVPASMVPSYTGTSSYLLFSKYNNYVAAEVGPSGGDGVNKVAILDPYATETDPNNDGVPGFLVMKEVLTQVGPTPDTFWNQNGFPNAVREWCINDTAVDPFTKSVIINSEDGNVYRWDLTTNTLSQAVKETSGIGEPYTSTEIGPDGTVYATNGGTLFALGAPPNYSFTELSSANPAPVGQLVTFTATLASSNGGPTPTGQVTFFDGPKALGSTGVTNGQAALSTTFTTVGSHFISVSYSGDANYSATSIMMVQTVTPGASVTVSSSNNPSLFGQAVTFTAIVQANPSGSGVPTGTVTFEAGGNTLGSATLSSGKATFTTSALPVGTSAITAVYSGDANFPGSTSTIFSQTVNADATSVTVASSLNPAPFGEPVTFTATVTAQAPGSGTPTGTVTFKDGSSTLGAATLSGGSATFTATLSEGSHPITAVYGGDGSFNGSLSAAFTQTISKEVPATFGLSGLPAATTAGAAFSVTVTALDAFGNPVTGYTGTVQFTSSDPQAALPPNYTFTSADMGVHTFTVTLKTAGPQSLQVADTQSGLGGSATVTVNPGPVAALEVTAPTGPVSAGVSVPITVAATDAFGNVATNYTGTVHFSSSDPQATLPADAPVSGGGPTIFNVTFRTAGTQTITATDTVSGAASTSTVTVDPAAANHFEVVAPASAGAGSAFGVTVTALDPFDNVASGYTGTIHWTSSDPQASLPADYTFAGADKGVHTFTVTLRTAGSQTLTASDTANGAITGGGTVTVAAGAFAHLALSAPSNASAGVPITVTVTALDSFGNVVTGYTGTVHFSSTDHTSTLPSDYTFVAADQGVHTFIGGIALRLTGAQQLTVTAAGVSASTAVSVSAGPLDHFAVAVPLSSPVGAPFGVTVTALDAFNNVATGYTGTVHFTSTDPAATLPADYTFTAADAGVHAFAGLVLRSAGNRTVAAVDAANPTAAGTSTVVVGAFWATGAGAGGGPEVKVYAGQQGALRFDFMAYDPHFLGGVRVALADVTGDGVPDIITAPGPGGGPDIRVYDGATGALDREFLAYSPFFTGGVFVAAADLNGDGHADIITGPDTGGGPDVRVFDGASGALIREFLAYGAEFMGGVRLATGDVNGDGVADIITGAGPGGSPHVQAFSGRDGTLLMSFLAYSQFFTGGVYVAAGDVNSDGHADIITGAGAGGGPEVKVYSGADGTVLRDFLAYGPFFTGGVRVAAVNFTGAGPVSIVTGAGPSGGPNVQTFDGASLAVLDNLLAYNAQFGGGVFVGGY
jgi:hypothetical protein